MLLNYRLAVLILWKYKDVILLPLTSVISVEKKAAILMVEECLFESCLKRRYLSSFSWLSWFSFSCFEAGLLWRNYVNFIFVYAVKSKIIFYSCESFTIFRKWLTIRLWIFAYLCSVFSHTFPQCFSLYFLLTLS